MKTTTSIAALLMTSALLSCAKPAADKAPAATFDEAAEKAAIMASYQKGCQGFSDGDIEAAMSPYSRDLFLYDFAPPYKSDYEHLKQANIALREKHGDQSELHLRRDGHRNRHRRFRLLALHSCRSARR